MNDSEKVKGISIGGKSVLFDKDAIAKEFLEEIGKIENPQVGSPT